MITVRFNDDLNMFAVYIDGEIMMKNKKESTLYKKLYQWLLSQGR